MLIFKDCGCIPGHWACAVPFFQTLAFNNLWPWNQSWLFMLGLILCGFIQPRVSFHLCQPGKDIPPCLHFWSKIIVQIHTHTYRHSYTYTCNHVYMQAEKCMYAYTLMRFHIDSHRGKRPHGEWLWLWVINACVRPVTWPVWSKGKAAALTHNCLCARHQLCVCLNHLH